MTTIVDLPTRSGEEPEISAQLLKELIDITNELVKLVESLGPIKE